ncbi:MAG: hypothetical protein LBK03_02075 [Bacteroidales bacterium]|jgi:hypothetical protein|nr:hypothetical protein [Bacteroidales bacterium]
MKQKRQKQICHTKTLASQCTRAIVSCLVLILLLTAGSCEKPCKGKEPCIKQEDKSIIGSWKLVTLYPYYDFNGERPVVDYSDSSIVFTFKANSTLLVSGSVQEGYLSEGEYIYTYNVINMNDTSLPGPNLYINNHPFFCTVSEQATKLGINEINAQYGLSLIKLKNK